MAGIESPPEQTPVAEPAGAVPRSVADRVLGVVGGVMVLLAIVLLFVGGSEDGAAVPENGGPPLELVQPRHGSAVRTERLVVVFRVEGEQLKPMPGGWGADAFHLHLNLDGTELMPSPTDIERTEGGLYRWTLPRPGPGLHTLQLFWSGMDHRRVQGGESRAVQVLVED